jgi:hypothetical protein
MGIKDKRSGGRGTFFCENIVYGMVVLIACLTPNF